jgi:hypothetical protein
MCYSLSLLLSIHAPSLLFSLTSSLACLFWCAMWCSSLYLLIDALLSLSLPPSLSAICLFPLATSISLAFSLPPPLCHSTIWGEVRGWRENGVRIFFWCIVVGCRVAATSWNLYQSEVHGARSTICSMCMFTIILWGFGDVCHKIHCKINMEYLIDFFSCASCLIH